MCEQQKPLLRTYIRMCEVCSSFTSLTLLVPLYAISYSALVRVHKCVVLNISNAAGEAAYQGAVAPMKGGRHATLFVQATLPILQGTPTYTQIIQDN